jgi:hypothetical protein
MKKTGAAIIIVVLFLCAMPVLAGNCGCSKCVSSCGKTKATDMFQAASDWNDSFHPKPCILQPMKPMGPVSAEKTMWFQKLADSINRKCPAPKTCHRSCGK